MAIGTCDPASRGEAFNLLTLAMGNGNVTVNVRYGWDGVSTKETGCNGPLYQPPNQPGNQADRWAIQVVNNDSISWYVRTIGKKGQPRNVEFFPGETRTFTVTQATNAGYADITDFENLTLSTSPTGNVNKKG